MNHSMGRRWWPVLLVHGAIIKLLHLGGMCWHFRIQVMTTFTVILNNHRTFEVRSERGRRGERLGIRPARVAWITKQTEVGLRLGQRGMLPWAGVRGWWVAGRPRRV